HLGLVDPIDCPSRANQNASDNQLVPGPLEEVPDLESTDQAGRQSAFQAESIDIIGEGQDCKWTTRRLCRVNHPRSAVRWFRIPGQIAPLVDPLDQSVAAPLFHELLLPPLFPECHFQVVDDELVERLIGWTRVESAGDCPQGSVL